MRDKIIIGLYVISMLLVGLLCFWIGKATAERQLIKEVVRDTIIQVQQAEPIIIEKAKPKLIYKRDTIIETKPFIAVLDTIVKHDTILISYDYPENVLDLNIRQKPDSIIIQRVTIREKESQKWYETAGYILGGVVGGFLLGKYMR